MASERGNSKGGESSARSQTRDEQGQFDGRRQSGGNTGGSGDRGFAGMNDDEQREIARQGGEESARTQTRDEQGQFDGRRESGGSSNRGGGGGSNR